MAYPLHKFEQAPPYLLKFENISEILKKGKQSRTIFHRYAMHGTLNENQQQTFIGGGGLGDSPRLNFSSVYSLTYCIGGRGKERVLWPSGVAMLMLKMEKRRKNSS